MLENSGYKKTFLSKYKKSFRLFGEKNIRILFSFITIKGNSKAILLNVFEEKNKSDYESGKRVANTRKNEVINAFNS